MDFLAKLRNKGTPVVGIPQPPPPPPPPPIIPTVGDLSIEEEQALEPKLIGARIVSTTKDYYSDDEDDEDDGNASDISNLIASESDNEGDGDHDDESSEDDSNGNDPPKSQSSTSSNRNKEHDKKKKKKKKKQRSYDPLAEDPLSVEAAERAYATASNRAADAWVSVTDAADQLSHIRKSKLEHKEDVSSIEQLIEDHFKTVQDYEELINHQKSEQEKQQSLMTTAPGLDSERAMVELFHAHEEKLVYISQYMNRLSERIHEQLNSSKTEVAESLVLSKKKEINAVLSASSSSSSSSSSKTNQHKTQSIEPVPHVQQSNNNNESNIAGATLIRPIPQSIDQSSQHQKHSTNFASLSTTATTTASQHIIDLTSSPPPPSSSSLLSPSVLPTDNELDTTATNKTPELREEDKYGTQVDTFSPIEMSSNLASNSTTPVPPSRYTGLYDTSVPIPPVPSLSINEEKTLDKSTSKSRPVPSIATPVTDRTGGSIISTTTTMNGATTKPLGNVSTTGQPSVQSSTFVTATTTATTSSAIASSSSSNNNSSNNFLQTPSIRSSNQSSLVTPFTIHGNESLSSQTTNVSTSVFRPFSMLIKNAELLPVIKMKLFSDSGSMFAEYPLPQFITFIEQAGLETPQYRALIDDIRTITSKSSASRPTTSGVTPASVRIASGNGTTATTITTPSLSTTAHIGSVSLSGTIDTNALARIAERVASASTSDAPPMSVGSSSTTSMGPPPTKNTTSVKRKPIDTPHPTGPKRFRNETKDEDKKTDEGEEAQDHEIVSLSSLFKQALVDHTASPKSGDVADLLRWSGWLGGESGIHWNGYLSEDEAIPLTRLLQVLCLDTYQKFENICKRDIDGMGVNRVALLENRKKFTEKWKGRWYNMCISRTLPVSNFTGEEAKKYEAARKSYSQRFRENPFVYAIQDGHREHWVQRLRELCTLIPNALRDPTQMRQLRRNDIIIAAPLYLLDCGDVMDKWISNSVKGHLPLVHQLQQDGTPITSSTPSSA